LLDTHAWFWLVNGDLKLAPSARLQVEAAARRGVLYVHAISVWEIALLAAKRRVLMNRPIREWVSRALALPGLGLVPLNPEIAIESANLPGEIHRDPADRMIAAAARLLHLTLVTRDQTLLAYARAGHLRALSA